MTWLTLAALAGLGLISVGISRWKARSNFSQEWHRQLDREGYRNTYDGQSLDWTKVRSDFAAYRERTRA